MATPYSVRVYDEVSSTQDLAAELHQSDPVLVVAHRQQAGRGRGASHWITAPRALAASFAWRPTWPEPAWTLLPLVAGLAGAGVLGPGCRLKWPNDLVLAEAKVGGILTEGSKERIVIGIGVNLYWPDPPLGAGAIYASDPGSDAVEAVARAWADDLVTRLSAGPQGWDPVEYLERSDTVGRWVQWEPAGEGLAQGIGEDGALLVETEEGTIRLRAGEIRHLRPARP
jgi:BirA family biotin operon repressor/biotin-[acetyl-CoA-carboxylase] ligase